jgi:hypothetical protein
MEPAGEVGELLTFVAEGIDPENMIIDYLWSVGDTTFWGGSEVSCGFDNSGEEIVAVQAYDGYNFSETVDWRVHIAPLNAQTTELPKDFAITSIYPNPFNSMTTLQYSIPVAGDVEMTVFDLQGRTLLCNNDNVTSAGTVQRVLDFSSYPTGLYFVRAKFGGKVEMRKMVIIR